MANDRTNASLMQSLKPGEALRVVLRADYFEGQIPLKVFRERFREYPVLEGDPLVIEPVKGGYAVLTKFGAVVFWGCPDHVVQDIVNQVRSLPGSMDLNEQVRDTLDVCVGGEEDDVSFSEVSVRALTLDKLKIISLALAQSVALDRFEIEVQKVLRTFEPVVSQLRKDGRLALSTTEIMKAVGFAMEVRSATLANLTLFDAPPETWESEALTHLDSELYDSFDLEERLSAVNQKLDFLADVTATLMDALNNRKSHRLEWIIIILIVIELIFFVILELMRR
jgi:required for meiotic nuclear division protein 1